MGNESDASAMDVDLVKLGGSDQVVPRFSVNGLDQLLKSAQMQHGLRHGDYARYRRCCTARLRRLYKSLKFTQGRSKYTKREITQSTVSEVRLRKSVKWANLFSQLCTVKDDTRTSLEAEAVYEELDKYGDLENQVLCRERVEKLELSIRYCMHKLGKSNLPTSELLHIGEMEGPALNLFKEKLEVEKLLMEKLDIYESAVGDASTKGAPSIVVLPSAFEAVPRNPIVLDLVYNLFEFPSLEQWVRKDKKGLISGLWR